jgi:CRISPR system Cascade subunit CasC
MRAPGPPPMTRKGTADVTHTRHHLDIHILQNLPPSNANRDADGMPKTATYGGKTRARVSSQAWKRATRMAFPTDDQGIRSKKLAESIAAVLVSKHGRVDEAKALTEAKTGLAAAGIGGGKKSKGGPTGELAYLLLFGQDLAEKLADAIVNGDFANHDKTAEDKAKDIIRTADMPLSLALFGRMVADDKNLSVDASCQVAHAISTHAVTTELDYYTAVDDLRTEDGGAAMIGDIAFNSSTLYRYATVNLDSLRANMGTDSAADAVYGATEFIRAFATSRPTGMANSFANHTTPSVIVVSYRQDSPTSLVGGFENPVVDNGSGYIQKSAAQLAKEYVGNSEMFGPATRNFIAHRVNDESAARELSEAFGAPSKSFAALLEDLGGFLTKTLGAGASV